MVRATSAVLLLLSLPTAAFASLGGTVSSVEADRVELKAALIGISASGPYTVHSMQSPTGTAIREYYGSNGIVFGVAWDGEWQPDLRQLFGTYYERYQQARDAGRKAVRARGSIAVDDGTVVVRMGGHLRSVHGIAYAPQLLPAGVDPGVIK
jgi:hypothetical protein